MTFSERPAHTTSILSAASSIRSGSLCEPDLDRTLCAPPRVERDGPASRSPLAPPFSGLALIGDPRSTLRTSHSLSLVRRLRGY